MQMALDGAQIVVGDGLLDGQPALEPAHPKARTVQVYLVGLRRNGTEKLCKLRGKLRLIGYLLIARLDGRVAAAGQKRRGLRLPLVVVGLAQEPAATEAVDDERAAVGIGANVPGGLGADREID